VRLVRLRTSRVCALAAAILCVFVPAASAACANADAVPAAGTAVIDLVPYINATVCVLNEARAANGLAALELDPRLTIAAYWHAVDMTANRFFSHAGSDGKHAAGRATTQGYGADADSWTVGETLGWGEPGLASARAMVAAWLASPEHRPVVLNPVFRDVGVMVFPKAPVSVVPVGVTYVADFGVEEATEDPDDEPKAKKSSKSCRKLGPRKRSRCVKAVRRAAALQTAVLRA
jgi:cysteine-rich secretory family protein